ncbi:hypothetical protein E5288_WYG011601 [Bos mutus]|uniref:Uncharacterized protein n=1 Tax=Bos mutus TaxID=72004 RepID=A0A6B0RJW0_9CETA|nr:hypothetical protein [Bos mutus]
MCRCKQVDVSRLLVSDLKSIAFSAPLNFGAMQVPGIFKLYVGFGPLDGHYLIFKCHRKALTDEILNGSAGENVRFFAGSAEEGRHFVVLAAALVKSQGGTLGSDEDVEVVGISRLDGLKQYQLIPT